jgi:ABC-type lipoprotein release transport system permease subunit
MQLYLRLAWRNIWRHKRRTVTILVSIVLVLGMMMWYDGLMTGFQQAIYGNVIKVFGGNIQIHAIGYKDKSDTTPLLTLENDLALVEAAKKLPQVLSVSRRINTGGLVTSREGAFAVGITAIEPEVEAPLSVIAQNVISGRFLTASDEDVVVIGQGLADALGVTLNDRISLAGRAQHEQMRTRTMTVIGIYDLGMADLEKRTVYISLAEAQNLYNLTGQTTEVAIVLERIGQEAEVLAPLKAQFPQVEIVSWETSFPELQAAVNGKSGAMDIFSVFIYLISGIGIFNLLMMAVYERTREIGMLGALGMKPRQIGFLFVLEGLMIGVVGVIGGVLFGLGINLIMGQVGMDMSMYSDITEYMALINGTVYPSLGLEQLPKRTLMVAVICALAALYPAFEASRREPADALHYV